MKFTVIDREYERDPKMNVAMFIEVNEHYFEMDFAEDYT
jgi:hypothetical protein